jgi:hypothetical protein
MAMMGLRPDAWQKTLLNRCSPNRRLLCLTGRQVGKSSACAAKAISRCLSEPGSLVLLLSPSQRQSGELFRKAVETLNALGHPVPLVQETATQLGFANGSRCVALPGSEATIRGFSAAALLIVDEAGRVPDELYRAVRPMLAVSGGDLICVGTPWLKAGWFYSAWVSPEPWERVSLPSSRCPRITAEFLAEERQALGERWYRREYECEFSSLSDSCIFSESDIRRCFATSDAPAPLFAEAAPC